MQSDSLTEVLEFEGNTCVRASAGTGKTFVLVEKYVRLLMEKEDDRYYGLENIVAITFTEKAADEMRQRISKRLYDEIQAIEKKEPEKGTARLLRHLNASRRRITQAYISTIHSFCARVLRENPVEAGIDPLFEIMDAPRSQAVTVRTLEEFLIMKLRKRDPAATDLAYRYGFDSDFMYESSLTKIISRLFPLVRAAGTGKGGLLAEYEEFMPDIAKRLKEEIAKARISFNYLRPLIKNEKALRMGEELEKGLAKLSPNIDAQSEKTASFAHALASSVKKNILPKTARDAADDLKDALGSYADTVTSFLGFGSAEKLHGLLGEFTDYLELNVKRRALLDFDDLQEVALNLFKGNPAVRDRYKKQFRHVLVDEFQDVNGIQREIIYTLADPSAVKEGDTKLFIVGDPKQAIYGFRGGDVEVFEETQRDILKTGGKIFYLKTNRRSVPELVDFANAYFKNCQGIFAPHDECGAYRDGAGSPAVENMTFTEGEPSLDNARYREAHKIAGRIREIVGNPEIKVFENETARPPKYGDMVILFRKFTQLPLYEKVLNAAMVPNIIHKGTGFYQNQEVADLLSVLSFIEDPSDAVAWVGAMRSPYAGCSDETILALRLDSRGKPVEHPFRADVKTADVKNAGIKIADTLEREKFLEFTAYTALIRTMKDRMTISEVIETVIEESGITGILGAQPNGLQKVGNVQKLIETARTVQRTGNVSLKNFVRNALNMQANDMGEPQAQVGVTGQNAVRIMTIHQSKGLEFPIVFLADINSGGQENYSPVIFNQRRGIAAKHVDKSTLRTYGGAVYKKISGLNAQKEADDELRLFYVACTRARDRLFLSGFKRKYARFRKTDTLANMMESHPELFSNNPQPGFSTFAGAPSKSAYDALIGPFTQGAQDVSKGEVKIPADLLPAPRGDEGGLAVLSINRITTYMRCPHEYILRHVHGLAPSGKGEKQGTPHAEIGTAVHGILEMLDFETNAADFKKSLINIADRRMVDVNNKFTAEVCENVARLYHADLFKGLRRGDLKESGREIPFTARYGRNGHVFYLTGRIDMLMRKGGTDALVLDYKYSAAKRPDDAARFQAELYALAMARRLGMEKITCAVAYLKNNPPGIFKWEITGPDFWAIEEKAVGAALGIAALEKGEPAPFGGIETGLCQKRSCGFYRFCFGK